MQPISISPTLIWGIILVIGAVLAFCMPFFVLKIRNQVVEMNKKLSQIIYLLENKSG